MTILKLPKHIDPELLSKGRRSSAPYNFIPLPEKVVVAVNDPRELPGHDTFANPNYPYTGYFGVTLTTKSPLYVRGMLIRGQFDLDEQGLDSNRREVKNGVTRITDRFKNNLYFFHTGDPAKPIIPGSSSRGMLRSLLEIISYSKVSRVSNKKLIYRAVGDTTALGSWYREQMLGANQDTHPDMFFDYPLSQLKGGYLCKHRGQWAIRPAVEHLGESFVHVEYKDAHPIIGGEGRQICHDVYVEPAVRTSPGRGKPGPGILTLNLAVTNKVEPGNKPKPAGMEKAVLVESGHMGNRWGTTPISHQKHMHCAIYEPDSKADPITIPQELWLTYEEDREMTRGARTQTRKIEKRGDPLFYLTDSSGTLVFFGPTMMFRLPYKNTVWSMIPGELRQPLAVDFADAMFGFVREKSDFKTGQPLPAQGEKARAYASRIHVSDAELDGAYTPETLWMTQNERRGFAPHVLSTPKPTSFQHYLVQEKAGKPELSHYDSPTKDAEGNIKGHKTIIRGAKRYWPQGNKTLEDLQSQEKWEDLQVSTQHTLINPVRSGVRFKFRIYFENLSNEELGALCWALHPLGDEGKEYCHQIGMGKPLGMGTVKLDATLHLNNRKDRYETLFDGDGWATGYAGSGLKLAERGDEVKAFTDAFEARIRRDLNVEKSCSRLAELKRIAMLLKMMEWENGLYPADTETQKLKGGFTERRVLPDPSLWIPKMERDKLIEPTPTQNPASGGVAQPGAGVSAKPQSPNKVPQSGIGNTIGGAAKPPVTAATKAQATKEKVTLVGQIKNGRAQVKTEQGEEITCEKMPTSAFNAPKPGNVVWAKVERDHNGKAIGAKYIPD